MKKLLPLAMILCVSVAMPAMAKKDSDRMGDSFFKKIDANGDGVINKSENDAFARKMFEEADANKDRMVSRSELADHKRREHEKHFGKFDRERDGYHHGRVSPSAGGYDFVPRSGSAQDRRAYDEEYNDREEWYGNNYRSRY